MHGTAVRAYPGILGVRSDCAPFEGTGWRAETADLMRAESEPPSTVEKPPPYRTERSFTVGVRDSSRVARADVNCALR